MMMLIERPDIQERLRRDPTLIPQIFDETLRLEPPVVSLFRVCTRDVELGGRQLRKGDAVRSTSEEQTAIPTSSTTRPSSAWADPRIGTCRSVVARTVA